MVRTEIRIVGSGGQGAITMGELLAKTATVYEGKIATQVMSYGAKVRGGDIWTEVVISDEEIDYPGAIDADIYIFLSQEAVDKHEGEVKKDRTVIIDSSLVNKWSVESMKIYQVPASELSEKELGSNLYSNMILLGFLVALTGIIKRETIIKAVRETVKYPNINTRALEIGFALADRE
ncbi:MAG: 2-oxoacid:acceptor oxidoreductase family protein [Candidatus Jordarchaeum sp.]|uniref:2-oxoacid:acceptor oxidoreductase family protein n=1 Tax=Candidatus Jordarchaeum sp. TaxID=2823881 RepID=UPI00404963E4